MLRDGRRSRRRGDRRSTGPQRRGQPAALLDRPRRAVPADARDRGGRRGAGRRSTTRTPERRLSLADRRQPRRLARRGLRDRLARGPGEPDVRGFWIRDGEISDAGLWSAASGGGPLVCPRCAISYPLSERFCPKCEMPLVYAGTTGEGPVTETHERATQDQAAVHAGRAGQGRLRPQPGRGGADPGPAARGGHPQLPEANARIRRSRLPRRRAARHPRPRGRRRDGQRAARRARRSRARRGRLRAQGRGRASRGRSRPQPGPARRLDPAGADRRRGDRRPPLPAYLLSA